MYVRVCVTPNARREKIIQKNIDTFDVFVREPAKNNLANTRVAQMIAEHYETPIREVRLISGHRSLRKVFSVESGAVL